MIFCGSLNFVSAITLTPFKKRLMYYSIIHKAFVTLHRPAPGRCAKSYGFILSDNCDNVKNSVKIL